MVSEMMMGIPYVLFVYGYLYQFQHQLNKGFHRIIIPFLFVLTEWIHPTTTIIAVFIGLYFISLPFYSLKNMIRQPVIPGILLAGSLVLARRLGFTGNIVDEHTVGIINAGLNRFPEWSPYISYFIKVYMIRFGVPIWLFIGVYGLLIQGKHQFLFISIAGFTTCFILNAIRFSSASPVAYIEAYQLISVIFIAIILAEGLEGFTFKKYIYGGMILQMGFNLILIASPNQNQERTLKLEHITNSLLKNQTGQKLIFPYSYYSHFYTENMRGFDWALPYETTLISTLNGVSVCCYLRKNEENIPMEVYSNPNLIYFVSYLAPFSQETLLPYFDFPEEVTKDIPPDTAL